MKMDKNRLRPAGERANKPTNLIADSASPFLPSPSMPIIQAAVLSCTRDQGGYHKRFSHEIVDTHCRGKQPMRSDLKPILQGLDIRVNADQAWVSNHLNPPEVQEEVRAWKEQAKEKTTPSRWTRRCS